MPPLPPSRFFPPAETADAEGMIGFGGQITPEWILDAYKHGIFPWPIEEGMPTAWWSPDPRPIIEIDRFHIPRRLKSVLRSGRFEITFDRGFVEVIRGCATAKDRSGGTWITREMFKGYVALHRLGHAHSVEARLEGKVVGGVYGVAIGGLFAAESMFYRVPEASKVALVHLVERLRQKDFELLDIQQLTPHTARFGAIEIPRKEFLRRLEVAVKKETHF
jgi:leucyl/phenylalanyl-tRNA---protein transferase